MTITVLVAAGLTILWTLLTQDASVGNIVLGLILAAISILLNRRAEPFRVYSGKLRIVAALKFTWSVLVDLVVSSLYVAWDVVTPRMRSTPYVVGVPLRITGDGPISILGNSITLTPGTLTVDATSDPERPMLLIHALYEKDATALIKNIRAVEDRLIPALPESCLVANAVEVHAEEAQA
jgi:multisubunit Na+/H+ antiporter MnhE subunit